MRIQFWGMLSTHQSFGIHTLGICKALLDKGVDLTIKPICIDNFESGAGKVPGEYPKWSLDITKDREPQKDEIIIRLGFPRDVKDIEPFPNLKFPIAVWDSTLVEPECVPLLNKMTAWFSISEHTKQALVNSGVIKPVCIAGIGVDTSLFEPKEKKDGIFKFLFVGVAQGRKGIIELLQAYKRVSVNRKDTKLIIKSNSWGNLKDLDVWGYDNIEPIYAEYTREALAKLYQECDCFVQPSHGESFSMPALEAMSSGLPVITTTNSGLSTFISNENGYLIGSKPYPAGYIPGNQFAPNLDELEFAMRHVLDNRREAKIRGLKGAIISRERWSWEKQAEKMIEFIRGIT